jgi:hypothetical protein
MHILWGAEPRPVRPWYGRGMIVGPIAEDPVGPGRSPSIGGKGWDDHERAPASLCWRIVVHG